MNQIRLTLAAAAILTVSFASQALASPRPNSGHSNHAQATAHRGTSYGRSFHTNYHVNYGTRFDHGYFYRGRTHSHWTYQRYDSRYGCTCYWDPCCNAWYYWCQPANCYYPVSYCPYPSYCGSAGGCSSGGGVAVVPARGQVAPVGPGPVGPGPVGSGPVGPGPVGPSANQAPDGAPVPGGPPPIPAPVTPSRN